MAHFCIKKIDLGVDYSDNHSEPKEFKIAIDEFLVKLSETK